MIAAALAFAGGEAAKTVVAEGVKDAYRAVKGFLSGKYPQIDLTPVEKAPQSKPRQESGSSMPSRPSCARPARRPASSCESSRPPRSASMT